MISTHKQEVVISLGIALLLLGLGSFGVLAQTMNGDNLNKPSSSTQPGDKGGQPRIPGGNPGFGQMMGQPNQGTNQNGQPGQQPMMQGGFGGGQGGTMNFGQLKSGDGQNQNGGQNQDQQRAQFNPNDTSGKDSAQQQLDQMGQMSDAQQSQQLKQMQNGINQFAKQITSFKALVKKVTDKKIAVAQDISDAITAGDTLIASVNGAKTLSDLDATDLSQVGDIISTLNDARP